MMSRTKAAGDCASDGITSTSQASSVLAGGGSPGSWLPTADAAQSPIPLMECTF